MTCTKTAKTLCGKENCQICFKKSFASIEKSKYWSKQNLLSPNQVFRGSDKKYKFDCTCGHEFEQSLDNVSIGKWCSYCSEPAKKLCDKKDCQMCHDKSFASHEKAQYWSKTNILIPRQIFLFSDKICKFDCICGHEFESMLKNISNGGWCPYCSEPAKKLCDKVDCKTCHEKSFASHEKAQYWSKMNTLIPRQVIRGSAKKYKFDCICGHEFEKSLSKISQGRWCSYCANKKLCEKKDCQICHNKSFANHVKAQYWSKQNLLSPRQVFISSGNTYKFDCICGHEFESLLSNVSHGHWCPYCCEPAQKLCDKVDCQHCIDKSFESHEKAKYWSKQNILTPRQVFKNDNRQYKFDCENGHEFKASLGNISCCGQWCSICKHKTEKKILAWLKQHFKQFTIVKQAKFEWCRSKKKLPFDFYIKELYLIIELDGIQHFVQISNWKTPEHTRAGDVFKMKAALKHDISVIRLLQEDVLKDKNDWELKLLNSIRKYETPEVIYIENGTKYEFHQADMEKFSD